MNALLLYPNQLFDLEYLPKVQRVYLVEEPLLFGTDREFPAKVHKAKLVLLRAGMRRYAEEVLWPNGFEVEYVENGSDVITDTALVKAAFDGASEIVVFDPCDELIWSRLESAAGALEVSVPLRKLDTPNFYLQNRDIESYFTDNKSPDFSGFYQYMRERFDVLIDTDYHPYGGKLMHDLKPSKTRPQPELVGVVSYGDNEFVREAVTHVELKYSSNPGRTSSFIWPTNKEEALGWLDDFLKNRLTGFATDQHLVDPSQVWHHHSALSPIMNCGLLGAREIIESTLDYAATKDVPLESLEGFIRLVLGTREYARAIYVHAGSKLRAKNELGHKRRLTADWQDATTGVKPVDDIIKKAYDFGYLNDPEKNIVLMGMLLCGVHPDEAYRWMMSYSVSAYDWNLVTSIYGYSQYADGGELAGEVKLLTSAGVLATSTFEHDHWCDVWDGVWARFVDEHRLWLKKISKTGASYVVELDAMDDARRRVIGYRSQDFLDRCTTPE